MINPRAIIFDMDGLLIDSEIRGQQAWIQASAEWQYEMTPEIYAQVIGRTVPDACRIFSSIYGQDFPFMAIRERRGQIIKKFYEKDGIPLKSGVHYLLDSLKEWQIPCAVATSTSYSPAMEKLEKTGLKSYFQAVVTGDQIANGKPAPDIFLAAAAKINMPAPFCMVLEDSEAGIAGAHAAGMIPVMVPDLVQPSARTRELAAVIAESLLQVRQLLYEKKENA